ncbi:ATP-binding protein [Cytophagaceae bacterium ABcell3]|nr:ATP-binding protein [Cytophagaceae bacterium ABcell3]
MGSVKFKILLVYLLASACLIGLGYYSWRSFQGLHGEIKELSKPNIKSQLFNNIATDIGKLNTFYLKHSVSESLDTMSNHHSLIENIKNHVVKLKSEYNEEDTSSINTLDKIPELLDQIETEYFDIHKKKKENKNKFIQQLEKELSKALGDYNHIDPVYVIKSIKSEILMKHELDSIYYRREPPQKKKNSFLSDIFRKKADAEEEEKEGSMVITQSIKKDTLTEVSLDTISPAPPPIKLEETVYQVINRLYNDEISRASLLQDNARRAYAKNSLVSHKIETVINKFREKENEKRETKAQILYNHAKKFNYIILGTIVFFVIFSLVFLYLILKDIEKSRFYQNKLLLNQQRVERESSAKQKFLTTMSHELRTPLTSIIGYAELLDNNNEFVKAIKSSSKHLLHVTNEVLDMAKIVAGKIEIHPKPVNITQLLNEVRQNTIVLKTNDEVELLFDLPSKDHLVISDEVRFNQILYNLLHNALKFTNRGYISLSAKVTPISSEETNLIVEVKDTGIGIKKEDQQTIFDEYNQAGTHKNDNKGNGLGLGIVKELVKRLGGTISLDSEPEKGTSFKLDFVMKTAQKLREASDKENQVIREDLFNNKSIYIIDDDPLIAKLYKNIFEGYKAKVITQSNSTTALEHLLKNHTKYDLVITDLRMPLLSGIELLNRLVKHDKRPSKIVASTANVLLTSEEKTQLQMFDELLIKPVNKSTLLLKSANVLGLEDTISQSNTKEAGIKSDFQEETTSQSNNNKSLYNLDTIKGYAMGDEELLEELINDFIHENDKDLAIAKRLFSENQNKELGELIHKLSSRYRSVSAIPPVDAKKLEKDLLSANPVNKEEVLQLFDFWENINKVINADCKAQSSKH